MSTLVVTRGLPASGKTTLALAWVAVHPAGRARANRDDLRRMLHGGRLGTPGQETQVDAAQHAMVAALLAAGVDVVCDDTNLSETTVQAWAALAARHGATLEIWDLRPGQPDGVSLEECIARDAERTGPAHIGEDTIRKMWARQDRVLR